MSKVKYNHKEIEEKFQQKWAESEIYKTPEVEAEDKNKYYILDMFPYPSGAGLHVGHVEGYTATDILARFQRMNGKKVLHPMGWDAFGLPAENYAIKTGIHPRINTNQAIETFTKQMNAVGLSYDWSREIGTHNPDYYKWTQWFFLFLYKRGLAYKKDSPVNWCDGCMTVLANEQVVDGKCERCDTVVIQKKMSQWFFKITDYAERLINDLDKVDWPESTKAGQRNWIGKSEGAEVKFVVDNSDFEINVFTTRLDTIYGCTFIVLSPEHELADKITTTENKDTVKDYQEQAKKKTELERTSLEKEKTGVFTGAYAINPFNGKKVPIWISDFVISTYGTGALMAVPAHDERDNEFAKKFGLEIIDVVEPITGEKRDNEEQRKSIVAILHDEKSGKLLSINWGPELGGNLFIGGGINEGEDIIECAKREIIEETGYKNVEFVKMSEKIHHHYFAASKNVNRYIEATGLYFKLVDEERVEQKLEEDEKNKFAVEWISIDDARKKVNDALHKYVFNKFIEGKINSEKGILTDSAEFNGLTSEEAYEKMVSKAETEGFGTKKVNYKLRDWSVSRQRFWGAPIPVVFKADGTEVPLDESELPVMLPDDVEFLPTGRSPLTDHEEFHKVDEAKYGAGARRESDTMDTFVCSSWYFFRFADPRNESEFASKEAMQKWTPVDMYVGGAEHTVLHLMYARFFTKALYDAGYVSFDEPFMKLRHQGIILGEDSRKMSKRWGNVINPLDVIGELGADALRMYEMFMGPIDQMKPWNTQTVQGVRRFLDRVYNLKDLVKENSNEKIESELNKLIKKVTEDIADMKFNTAIAKFMEFSNFVEEKGEISRDQWKRFLTILAPFAPFVTEELWQEINGTEFTKENSIHSQSWPKYDESLIQQSGVVIGVQINGKLRAEVEISVDETEESVKEKVLAKEEVQKWMEGKEIKKFIYVKGKIVNIVV